MDPAVTESATKSPGVFRSPGVNSIFVEPLVAPVSSADAISAARSRPEQQVSS